METSKKTLSLALLAIVVLVSVSWIKNENNKKQQKTSSAYDAIFTTAQDAAIDEFEKGFFDEEAVFNLAGKNKKAPPADDVMVQRIPGDNLHLLVMAVYPHEKFSGPFVKINNGGEEVTLRDDGLENDKVAGDGIYTTKIFADVKEFRKQVVAMLKEKAAVKDNDEALFADREFKYSTLCESNPFTEAKFDKNEAVSISTVAEAATVKTLDKVRQNCIFLTDLSVVESSARTWNSCAQTGNVDGPWTFKTLMKQLATQVPSQPATDQKVSDFVKNWLNSWAVQKIINEDTVAARTLVNDKILNPWLAKSLAAGNPSGFLDMRFAPFKLTAIVNRFDLRERARGIPAGEGRMIFCLINSDCNAAENFTVIFEYGIAKPDNCDSLRSWAKRWYDLKDLTLGSEEYLSALQNITDQFTKCGSNPNRTNQSSLNSVRTNERALSNTNPTRWELREFGLNGTGVALNQRTVAQVPADKYNVQIDNADVRRMVKFINDNATGINADDYDVPAVYEGFAFLGGKSTILDTPVGLPIKPYHWDGIKGNSQSEAFVDATITRHIFSRNACSGCHAGEVQTFFTHVDPVFFGTKATLSGFLTGTAGRGGAVDADNIPGNDKFKVKDAAARGNGTDRFHVFSDIKRRATDLKQIATSTCGTAFSLRDELMFHPVGAVH